MSESLDRNLTATDFSPSDESRPSGERDAQGRFVPGQPGPALRHGLRSELVASGAMTEGGTEAMEDETRRIASGDHRAIDLGLAELMSKWLAIARFLGDKLQVEGPTTRTGRTKGAFKAFDTATNQVGRISERLGYKPGQRTLGEDFGREAFAALTPAEAEQLKTLIATAKQRIATKQLPAPPPDAAVTESTPSKPRFVCVVPPKDSSHE